MGVTLLMTAELENRYTDLRFSPHGTALLTDAIIVQRYVELSGRLKRIMGVVKVRGRLHANEFRLYDITDDGIVIGDVLDGYEGLLSARPSALATVRRLRGSGNGIEATSGGARHVEHHTTAFIGATSRAARVTPRVC